MQWHPIYGGHCAGDVASLAAFLESWASHQSASCLWRKMML
jgi:hypothetical protein